MKLYNYKGQNPILHPETISRSKKEEYLLSLSEDEFRDRIVRPIFLRLGLGDGRDLCGPSELGKDTVFVSKDELGNENLYAVQTKKGRLNMSAKASENVINATTQLRTALNTRVPLIETKKKVFPSKVILCLSGPINETARNYICDELNDPRMEFMDSDDIIPKIDKVFPEIWLGIETNMVPYLRNLISSLEQSSDILAFSDIFPTDSLNSAVTDNYYVPLRLYHRTIKRKKEKGKIFEFPEYQELNINAILKRKEILILITGEAGSGKSTALQRLAYLLCKKGLESTSEYQIPVLLKSTQLIGCKENQLLGLCYDESSKLLDSNTSTFSIEDLSNGRVTLLIDALDEIGSQKNRIDIIKRILEFHELYPKNKIIMTSRMYSFINDIDGIDHFIRFNLSPISYNQAKKIFRRLEKGKNLSSETSEEILRRIEQVHGMDLNPLLITIFAATADYSRKDIPANITELFKKFTEIMLGRWDTSKGLAQQYHAPLKDFILTQIAYRMHKKKQTSIPLQEFTSMIKEELRKRGHEIGYDTLSNEITERSGLFRIIDDNLEFRHHLLQEFFAGRGIPTEEEIPAYVSDDWWRRSIVFYFGNNPGNGIALSHVADKAEMEENNALFNAAITLGLSLQACYLVETENRLKIFKWVVKSLARSCESESIISDNNMHLQPSLLTFLSYYLYGRDSVACDMLKDHCEELLNTIEENSAGKSPNEYITFWLIVGVFEAGHLDLAESLIRKFHPSDIRLLLALHLGSFLVLKLRSTSRRDKKIAERIIDFLDEKIKPLRRQLVDEFKSELLEVRKGKVEILDGKTDNEE